MTWTLIIFLIVTSFAKLITAPPNIVVVWLTKKYAMHQKLVADEVVVTYGGRELKGTEKEEFTNGFSEGSFLEKHYIFPGNEEAFLHPETDVKPYVIQTKQGKKDVTLYVYKNDKNYDVVKQSKKKVISYSLFSPELDKIGVAAPIAN